MNDLPDNVTVGSFSAPEPEDWKIGDLVVVSPYSGFPKWADGVVYRITKRPANRSQVNYMAEPANGIGHGLRGPAYSFAKHDGPAPEPAKGCPSRGTIVRVLGKDGLFVVEKVNPDGLAGTVIHVNGNGNGYRNVAGARLTEVHGEVVLP